MAHLWIEESSSASGEPEWMMRPLDGESAVPLTASHNGHPNAGPPHAALLLCSWMAEAESWLIMSVVPAGVALNGTPLRAGIRLLTDRDEIRIAGLGRVFFATERLARAESFAGADQRIDCPRCKQEIVAGTVGVRCPACARWFHQSAELSCWTYSDRCLCPQPTALDHGFRWSPHGL